MSDALTQPDEIALSNLDYSLKAVNWFIGCFGYAPWKGTAYWNQQSARYVDGSTTQDMKAQIREEMLASNEGLQALAARPRFAGAVLSATDPDTLDKINFDTAFGDAKNKVLAEAVIAMGLKSKPTREIDPNKNINPQVALKLALALPPEVLNDKTPGARTRGLGARACQSLWLTESFDGIVTLMEHGVDASLAAPGLPGQPGGRGLYSGFVQPIEHVAQKCLRDVDRLDRGVTFDNKFDQTQAEGARKVLGQLAKDKNKAITLVDWKEVTRSELVTTIKDKPGTIWGFEDIRLPFVQAAHEAETDPAPIRMMELWDAVAPALEAKAYRALLAKPKEEIKKLVERGVKAIRNGAEDPNYFKKIKYQDIKKDLNKFIENFEKDATAFLESWVGELPKGELDGDAAGIGYAPFMAGFACKAGLWWAKKEKKPVYYCLDGIKMEEITNYKEAKNKAIEAALTKEGPAHWEVVTFVEVREILKNWEELKTTVVFVRKGAIVPTVDVEKEVQGWIRAMEESKKRAGRTPAPGRQTFAAVLNGLHPDLMAKLPAGKEGDQDARDLAKKSSYLLNIAKMRKEVTLKYIMSRCQKLVQYKLLSEALPDAARSFATANPDQVDEAAKALRAQINLCNAKFQGPLVAALLAA